MKSKVKFLPLLALLLMITVLFAACSKSTDSPAAKASVDGGTPTVEQFFGKKAAVQTGMIWDGVVDRNFSPREKLYYDDNTLALKSVLSGKTDYALISSSTAGSMLKDQNYAGLSKIDVPLKMFDSPLGGISKDPEMVKKYNSFLHENKAVLDDMVKRWVTNADYTMPKIDVPTSGKPLVVAIVDTFVPWGFSGENGQITGFEVENAKRFAAYLGRPLEIKSMTFSSVIPYVASGKADIALSCVTITEERKKAVLFTESYASDNGVLVYKSKAAATTAGRAWNDFLGKNLKIGVETGDACDVIAKDKMGATTVYYTTVPNMLADVRNGKTAGCILPSVYVGQMKANTDYKDMDFIKIPDDVYISHASPIFHTKELRDKYNAWLAKITESGELKKMQDFWYGGAFPKEADIPKYEFTGKNGVLRCADTGNFPPLSYFIGNKLVGYDVDLISRFAISIGMKPDFKIMDYSGISSYVISGKADMSACTLEVTPERAKEMIFGGETVTSRMYLVVNPQEKAKEQFNFFSWVQKGFENNLIKENRYQLIVNGLLVTVKISLLSLLFGTLIGAFHAFMLTRKNKICAVLAKIYGALIHGTPIIVLLMISYYIVFGKSQISPILIAVAAFALVQGAVIGEQIHDAIITVDPVEIEAARSIGYTSFGAFKLVTLPQAVKRVMPAYFNGFVELVKSTAIVGYIAIQDLSCAGDIIRSRTYDAYFPLLFVALVYLLVTGILVFAFKRILALMNRRAAK